MADENKLGDWELLVRRQLKTDDIYPLLSKENLEGLVIRPYYSSAIKPSLPNLAKCEESTHLVSPYYADADENTYAFLLSENVDGLQEKTIFVDSAALVSHIKTSEDNSYFSLVDLFNKSTNEIDEDTYKYLKEKDFKRKICIDVALHQNAGASIVQQLGIALAKSRELAEKYGPEIIKQLIFRVAVGANYFFEIAKIRALKILFWQFAQEYGLQEVPYIFAETTSRNKTGNDEENNLIRSTFELAAAMIGGADAVYANDYKVHKNNVLSAEISFKQQIVLAYESIINVFEDAANGSFYIDDISLQLCEKSWQFFREIEEAGGYITMMNTGQLPELIRRHAMQEQAWVMEGRIKLIGANLFPKLEAKKTVDEMYPAGLLRPVRWSEMYE